jgi:hypothetical protein
MPVEAARCRATPRNRQIRSVIVEAKSACVGTKPGGGRTLGGAMAETRLVKLEQLRFLRDTARKMRELADPETPNKMRFEMLRLAGEIEQEANDLEVISLQARF